MRLRNTRTLVLPVAAASVETPKTTGGFKEIEAKQLTSQSI